MASNKKSILGKSNRRLGEHDSEIRPSTSGSKQPKMNEIMKSRKTGREKYKVKPTQDENMAIGLGESPDSESKEEEIKIQTSQVTVGQKI